eukprot:COSAG02_NODE_978_length_15497_cov_11.288349_7_plen_235_part_00
MIALLSVFAQALADDTDLFMFTDNFRRDLADYLPDYITAAQVGVDPSQIVATSETQTLVTFTIRPDTTSRITMSPQELENQFTFGGIGFPSLSALTVGPIQDISDNRPRPAPPPPAGEGATAESSGGLGVGIILVIIIGGLCCCMLLLIVANNILPDSLLESPAPAPAPAPIYIPQQTPAPTPAPAPPPPVVSSVAIARAVEVAPVVAAPVVAAPAKPAGPPGFGPPPGFKQGP